MASRRHGTKFICEIPVDSWWTLAGEDIHVFPTYGRAHDTDHGIACWCGPERDGEEPRVIVHRPEQ